MRRASIAATDRDTRLVDRNRGMPLRGRRVTGDLGFHASYSGDGTKLYYVRGTQGWSGVAYQYDLSGRLTGITYPSGRQVVRPRREQLGPRCQQRPLLPVYPRESVQGFRGDP
jgi:hypothetical protein